MSSGKPAGAVNAVDSGTVLPTGVITTGAGGIKGSGLPTSYGLKPQAVTLDGPGLLLIADAENNVVWLANGTAAITTTLGTTIPARRMAVVAGVDFAGFSGDGGPATRAALNGPLGVAVDGAGNLFIADSKNNRIRKVLATTGVISTAAGNGVFGFGGDGGPATQAELETPSGVAVGNGGSVYIADSNNNRIRAVLAHTTVITTIAGTGNPGYGGDGGPATQAELQYPTGLAVGSGGTIYIADSLNNRIRALPASGTIYTMAGDGTPGYGGDGGFATKAKLDNPQGVALDASGTLVYIADTNNNRIREVDTTTGFISTVAGVGTAGFKGDGGPSTKAALNAPTGVAVDNAGNFYIAASLNYRVREVTAANDLINTIAGNGTLGLGADGGFALRAEMYLPGDVAVDGAGNLFIADTANNVIREVQAASGNIVIVAGDSSPGCVYGSEPACFGGDGGPATKAALNSPFGVAVDSAGNLFIADSFNNRIREVLASTGIITTVAGTGTAGYSGDGGPALNADLFHPLSVAVDNSTGNYYIADSANNRVREVLAAGAIIQTVAGTGRPGYSGDGGPGARADLNNPSGVVTSPGHLYIADTNNNRIRQVVLSGRIYTVAGIGTAGFSGDGGPADTAQLNYPTRTAVDSGGDLYIADTFNNRVREVISGTATITTVAGGGTGCPQQVDPFGDGCLAPQASLNSPTGVAVNAQGLIGIVDTNSNRLRIFHP